MVEEIKVEIDTDGSVQIEVQGVKGKRCKDVTRQLEAAMGRVKSDHNTREFYENPPQQQRVRR